MKINNLTLKEIPLRLRRLSDAPATLYASSNGVQLKKLLTRPCVAIIGSRKVSPYGRQVTADLTSQLAGQGIVVVSGLALGVDGIAHQATVEAGGQAIAVLPGPLQQIYPATHRWLAQAIIDHEGLLISEYPAESPTHPGNFIARNRLIAGLADAVLITEAAEKSGSLHTADFALQQAKTVMAVPGNITSPTSVGTNALIRAGATPVTSASDVLEALGIPAAPHQAITSSNPAEQAILTALAHGITEAEALQRASQLAISEFNQSLTMLEITGKIRSLGANHWALRV